MRIFHKIQSFFSSWLQLNQPDDFVEWQFVIPEGTLDEPVQQALTDHIQLWSLIVHQASIETSKEQMPPGCICIQNFLRGGKLEYSLYLKTQVEYVAKTTISVHRTC